MFSFSSPILAAPQQGHRFSAFRPSSPFHYSPPTPSPLRTSCNANIMSSPPSTTSFLKSSPLSYTPDDVENQTSTFQHSFPHDSSSTTHTLPAPSASTHSLSTPSATTNPFTVPQPRVTHVETRSRSNSPIATLSNHIKSTRDRRKTQFIDRLRSKQAKDDDRFEKQSDQVLRMDFVRERREWEEMMARKAEEAGLVGMDEDMVLEDEDNEESRKVIGWEDEGGGMSPPDEELPLEELAEYLQQRRVSGTSLDEFGVEDEEYERAMLEVLASQETEAGGLEYGAVHQQKYDGSMDMS